MASARHQRGDESRSGALTAALRTTGARQVLQAYN
jgi:hypothetical protein